MAGNFAVKQSNVVDAVELLRNVQSLKELLQIDFPSDSDNILLLRKAIELIVLELGKLNSKVGNK